MRVAPRLCAASVPYGLGACQIGVRVLGMARRRRLTTQDLQDEITVTGKAASACRFSWPNPSASLAECLASIARQTERRIPRYASVGTASLRQQLQDAASKVRQDADNVMRKSRAGRYY